MLQHLSKLLRTTAFGAFPQKPQATLRTTVSGKSRLVTARKSELTVSDAQSALTTAMKRVRSGIPTPSKATKVPNPPTEKAKSAEAAYEPVVSEEMVRKTREPQQSERNDESFEMLRNTDLLDQYLNKTISIGQLSTEPLRILPYSKIPGSISIFLTSERIAAVKRFVSEMKMRENDVEVRGKSLILSGAVGVGKNVLSYLLGWTAYVNNCIVVPLDFPFDTPEIKAHRFLSALKLHNRHLLHEIKHYDEKKGEWTTLERFVDEHDSVSAFKAALKTLASYTHRPVVYVCVDHSSYWHNQFDKQALWRDWVVGSGPHGARTCVIYSEKANSNVKAHLTPHMRSWIIQLQEKFARKSLEPFLRMEGFPLSPLVQYILSLKGEAKEEELDVLYKEMCDKLFHL